MTHMCPAAGPAVGPRSWAPHYSFQYVLSELGIYTYIYTSSMSCVCWPANLKVTDPLVNYSFSNDHIANQGPPRARIVIELQTILLSIMGPPQF